MTSEPLFLGIDLGTSKVALVLCDARGDGIQHRSTPHQADLEGPSGVYEQDAETILSTAADLIQGLSGDTRNRIGAIGLTGQMHGVVQHEADGRATSPLVTWRDARPSSLVLNGRPVPPGRGWSTLDRWQREGALQAPRCATLHGLLAARLCRLDRAPIDPTDLAAWGGETSPPSLPSNILPNRVDHGSCVGYTVGVPGLPDGIPVAAPLGDNQASVHGTLLDFDREASFTIGTGCQLSLPIPRWTELPGGNGRCERRPFSSSHDLLVAAPRNGGLVWRWLAERVHTWSGELGGDVDSLQTAYGLLDRLGSEAGDELNFRPHLLGETWNEALTGSLSGLKADNGSLGQIVRAVAHGIAANARDALPVGSLEGRRLIRASGNALRRSELLRNLSAQTFGLPLTLSDFPEEAALGAARVARNLKINAITQ